MVRIAWVTLKRLVKDKTILIALLVVPLAIIIGFSFMTQPTNTVQPVKVAIVGDVPAFFEDAVSKNFSVFKASDADEAIRILQSGRVAGAFVFSQGRLETVHVASESVGTVLINKLENTVPHTPIIDSDEALKRQRQGLINFLINYMMFSLISIAADLTALKENYVSKRLTAMPLRAYEVFGGHVLAFAVLLFAQVGLVHVAIELIWGIAMVDVPAFGLLIMFGMILLILSLGLLVARFSRQSAHVPMIANAVMVPLMMVSGTFMNLDGLGWLSRVKYFTPQYWVSDAYNMINSGQNAVSTHFMVLMAMALFVFSISIVGKRTI